MRQSAGSGGFRAAFSVAVAVDFFSGCRQRMSRGVGCGSEAAPQGVEGLEEEDAHVAPNAAEAVEQRQPHQVRLVLRKPDRTTRSGGMWQAGSRRKNKRVIGSFFFAWWFDGLVASLLR